jgi:mannose-6-phosphate isomerase-like protein (cupin superfamily)
MSVAHHFVGGVYAKIMNLPPTHWVGTHRHAHDHLSVLAKGRAIVEVDGERTEYEAPTVLTIAAKKLHTIIPLTPCTWMCIHATSCTDPDDIDHELIARPTAEKEV